jgi:hypothetical protein
MSKSYKYSVSKTLSNGQIAKIFIKKEICQCKADNRPIIWKIGFIIENSRKTCNNWYSKGRVLKKVQQTGKCGLEGLLFAKNCLILLEDLLIRLNKYNKSKKKNFIVIYWSDEKRHKAYKRLLVNGYIEGHYNNAPCIFKEI